MTGEEMADETDALDYERGVSDARRWLAEHLRRQPPRANFRPLTWEDAANIVIYADLSKERARG